MNYQKILRALKSDRFIKIKNQSNHFEDGAIIYAKEITENIFLLFVIVKDIKIQSIKVLISHFDNLESIGEKKPLQTMFYLSIKDEEDLKYVEKYIKLPQAATT